MENVNEFSSDMSFVSSSCVSNGSSSPHEQGTNLEFSSLRELSIGLEKLLEDSEFDYSDAEIVVEGISVGVNRCILAARSQFFHEKFKKRDEGDSAKGKKPKFLMKDLLPHGWVGYEAFKVVLNYLYTGKVKPSPPEVSTCVDGSCSHCSCRPAINYIVELMYASATFQIKDLVMLFQSRLSNFVDKALVEDVIPILVVAYRCSLTQLLEHCVQRVTRSDLDDFTLEKELPSEISKGIKDCRIKSEGVLEQDPLREKSIRRILKALDSDDIELVKLLLAESSVTLDDACALHYAAAHCNCKVVNEVLDLGLVNLNLYNARGHTALHVAARRKDLSIIVGLLNHGASVIDRTPNGQNALEICRRLTRPKDYNQNAERGRETNQDRLCIDVLEREMHHNPTVTIMSHSLSTMANELLVMELSLFEERVALARALFPREAKLAMEQAHADSTLPVNLRGVDLNELPSEEVKSYKERLVALKKTVATGRRFFPNCSEVLDRLTEYDNLESLILESGTPEEQRNKKARFMELREEVKKAYYKDRAEGNWTEFSPKTTSSSTTAKCSTTPKARKR